MLSCSFIKSNHIVRTLSLYHKIQNRKQNPRKTNRLAKFHPSRYNETMANFYNQTTKEVLEQFSVNPEKGLSSKEVEKRQQTYGKNILKVATTPLWRKLIEPFVDIFMVILVIALILSAIQQNWIETITIGIIIAVDAIIYYIQRFSTEKILESLKNSTIQTITVLRDGEEQAIESTELVPGDIVILREGDRIPADGRIVNESGLLSNESMLTGESEAIAKDAKAISGPKKVYEQRNMVFAGSFVITGTGKFVVTATGNETEYGRIASLATSLGEESPIQAKMNKLVAQIAVVVVILAFVVLIIQLVDGIDLLDALEFTLAMIVSAVPEGLPIAISIILALCAKRMAKKNALIKELQAIESIGIVTTIASDKTGTLTENRLELREIWTTEPKREFLDNLARTALIEPVFLDADNNTSVMDPLDTCIIDYLKKEDFKITKLEAIKLYAFDQSIKLSGNLYRNSDKLILRVKGAPETILSRSGLSPEERDAADAKLIELANKGYKVIAIASAEITREINELGRLDRGNIFKFEGLIAVADALRKEAPSAIRQAARMGVKTKMVTGDHAGTAYAIGRELGLADDFSQVLDCSKLGNISDEDLADAVKNITIFARVTPEDKYRVLSAIKTTEICAMTGDGVNDVPALVGAHVGIAMGDSPSIVQDAGDIVLLDNNFKNISEAIKESRTVLANIRRMLGYLLATNAGEALTMLGALIFSGSQLLTPIQILWINLVTDSLMVIPIGLEPPEQKILRQKPEAKDAPILSGHMFARMTLIAFTMAATTLATFYISRAVLGSHEQANTLAFTALVVMQWASAFSARGTYESAWKRLKVQHNSFHLAILAAIILQILALFGPLMVIVNTVSVPILAIIVTVLVAFFIPLGIFEGYKFLTQRKK